jgi:hypothetical protein
MMDQNVVISLNGDRWLLTMQVEPVATDDVIQLSNAAQIVHVVIQIAIGNLF